MKTVRRIFTAILILVLSGAGISYAVRRTTASSAKPVEVVAVTSVNSSSYGFMESGTVSGTIISRDTQSVSLDSEHELKAVYVKAGDKVKKGDRLLEYDMEADELKAEMEDLTRRGLELNLETLNKDLAVLRSGRMPDALGEEAFDTSDDSDSDMDYEDSDLTGSSEDPAGGPAAEEGNVQAADDSGLVTDEVSGAADGEEDAQSGGFVEESGIFSDDSGIISDDSSSIGYIEENSSDSVTLDIIEDPVDDDYEPDAISASQDGADTTSGTDTDSGSAKSGDMTLYSTINTFLNSAYAITLEATSPEAISSAETVTAVSNAMELFEMLLADPFYSRETNLLGEPVQTAFYSVSDAVAALSNERTVSALQIYYDRLCAYRFIQKMMALNPEQDASSSFDSVWAKEHETQITEAADALCAVPESMSDYAGATAFSSGETMYSFLKSAAQKLNDTQIIAPEQPEADTVSTEGAIMDLGFDFDDGDADTGDAGYSAADIAEAIKEQERNIKETELQIREAELEIKDYQKVLDHRIVYSEMDGIVKTAGTVDSIPSGNAFILITGKAGLYVRGSINELSLDTIKVGDIITGTSYETGGDFTAEIVEISEYPNSGSDNFYGFGDENTNSSYYSFLAYIEDAEGMEVDTWVDLSLDTSSSGGFGGGLSLEEFYIRNDSNGRSYCFVRGGDGKLEKRYLEVGANNWGFITVKSGLTAQDYIAFPYGKGVEEGADTVEVDSLSAVDGDDYF